MNHEYFMHCCLEIAQKGRGLTGSNPMVGAVLVRGETLLADGVYLGKGKSHAEQQLLEKYEQKISSSDILYVNLEPCCHHGNTPPCTDAIIQSGIRTVVIGMKDPDKRVAGKGAKALRDAGITVIGPVIPELCRRVNKGFVSLRENGRPYITLKRAQTRDGAIAKPDGSKLCITSDTQNLWSHTFLRATHDAILVGVQTVITDDPQLSIRIRNSKCGIVNQPWKIILDPELRIPLEARVIDEKCIVITNEVHNAKGSREEKEETLKEKGAIVFSMPMENNQCNLHDLFSLNSKFLIQNSISTFLVEGGPKTWNAFTEAGMIDEEVILIG